MINKIILMALMLSISTQSYAVFYEDPINANNKYCVKYVNQTAEALRMEETLKQAVQDTKAKPTPAILGAYSDIYKQMSEGSKGILDTCKLNKEEKEKFLNIGIHAEQMKAGIGFVLNK